MKYFLGINQKIWQENYPKLDIETVIIFDVIKNFCAIRSNKIKKLILNNEEYAWVNYQMIIDELPILAFKSKGSISTRVNFLKKCGLIKIFKAPEGSLYIRLTEKASELIFEPPVHADARGVHTDAQPPVHADAQHNQTTNNNQTTKEYTANAEDSLILKEKNKQLHKLTWNIINKFKEQVKKDYKHEITVDVSDYKAARSFLSQYGELKVESLLNYYYNDSEKYENPKRFARRPRIAFSSDTINKWLQN